MTTETTVPATLVYCPSCRSQNSWERNPERDWLSDTGAVIEYSFKCRVCGAVTMRSAKEYKRCTQ